jgi:hypothetical protein
VYLVTGGPSPRWQYTIGLAPRHGAELLLAGATAYPGDVAVRVLQELVSRVGRVDTNGTGLPIEGLGTFTLRPVHRSWTDRLALGAQDFYQDENVPVWQIMPDEQHWTVDTPDLACPRNPNVEPVWRWLTEPWPFAVSTRSIAVTNMAALRGQRVTEGARWALDEWELFAGAGPDVRPEDVRRVPLATLLGADPTLVRMTELEVGVGLWRDPTDLVWQEWRQRRNDA